MNSFPDKVGSPVRSAIPGVWAAEHGVSLQLGNQVHVTVACGIPIKIAASHVYGVKDQIWLQTFNDLLDGEPDEHDT